MNVSKMNEQMRILVVVIFTFLLSNKVSVAVEHERQLIQDLLSTYDVNVRPVATPNDKVDVTFDMALNQILDLDERNQVLTANYWMRMKWKDATLKWNPSAYGGITNIRLSVTRIWRPDITLYNDVSNGRVSVETLYPATVSYDSTVKWNYPMILYSSCPLDVSYFPWDRQKCELEFGSWTYDGDNLDIHNKSAAGDMAYWSLNGEWIFEDFPARKRVEYYPEPYPTVIYTVDIQRKPLYYIYNMVLPCTFITFCGLLVFFLPPDSGEKVSLSVTVLLASTVFLLLVAEVMPPQSDVIPLVGMYFSCTIVLLVLSTVLTVVVLNAHHHGALGTPAPAVIQVLVLQWLALVVGKKAVVKQQLGAGWLKKKKVEPQTNNNGITTLKLEDLEDMKKETNGYVTKVLQDDNGKHNTQSLSIEERSKREWMLIAMIMDRVFLILFFLVIIICTLAILLDHPY